MTADLKKLQRRIGGFPIELPAAAALAFAVALATMALPDWRFESAVTMSGLPSLVSAAQPPLGTTARVLVALILSALSFAAVFLGLRALDRQSTPTGFPAFRTEDLHPDAPRRRPILAGAEFGTPDDDPPPIEAQLARGKVRVSEPMPSFMAPEPTQATDFMDPPEYKEIMEDVAADEVSESATQRHLAAEPVVMPAFLKVQANAVDDADSVDSAGFVDDEDFAEDDVVPDERADTGPQLESVTRLMARLETGLARQSGRMRPGGADPARMRVRRALVDLDGGA